MTEWNGSTANGRWRGIQRTYTTDHVVRLRGTVEIEHTLARRGAERLWELLHGDDYVAALGALTGGQAVQMVKAGSRRSTSPAGRSPPTRTSPARPTPTRACIPRTAFRPSSAA